MTFELDTTRFLPALWMHLGEAQSKCAHLAQTPLRREVAQKIQRFYLTKGVLATTAIEGNTLSEEQAQGVIDGTVRLPPSKEYMGVEIQNIVAAVNGIAAEIPDRSLPPLSAARICAFNRQVLQGLQLDPDVQPGRVRKHSVEVGRYRGAPAEDCEHLLERLCAVVPTVTLGPGSEQASAILQAIFAHVYVAWIHPFGDGNGRTARLIESEILLRAGVPLPASLLLSNHYNQTRTAYYLALAQTSRGDYNLAPFFAYAVQGFVDGLAEQLALIREQLVQLVWHDMVAKQLSGVSASVLRRRALLVALGDRATPLTRLELLALNPELNYSYSKKTTKTLSRDLADLAAMQLLTIHSDGRVSANLALVNAFLPLAHRPATKLGE